MNINKYKALLLTLFTSIVIQAQDINAIKMMGIINSKTKDVVDYLNYTKWEHEKTEADNSVFKYKNESLITIYNNNDSRVIGINIITKSNNILNQVLEDLKRGKSILEKDIFKNRDLLREYRYKDFKIEIRIANPVKKYDMPIFDIFVYKKQKL